MLFLLAEVFTILALFCPTFTNTNGISAFANHFLHLFAHKKNPLSWQKESGFKLKSGGPGDFLAFSPP